MKQKWLLTIRGQVPRTAAIVLGLVPIAILLVLWWAMTYGADDERRIQPTIMPSPLEVVHAARDLVTPRAGERGLLTHMGISLQRVALGYLLAIAVVLPLGILMGSFASIRAVFSPMTTASGYIPIATLVPLTFAWFGTNESQKVIFLAMAFSIYLLPLVINAIDGVPDVYLRTSYTLGANRLQVIRRVLIPIALPSIWQGMRLAFGVGWTYLVLAEVVVKAGGLGDLIDTARRRGSTGRVWLAIIVITLIAWVADLGWNYLGKLLFPYRRTRA